MSNKLLNGLAVTTLAVAMCLMFYFGYLLFWPFHPIDFLDGNFQTCKTVYHHGEPMCYRMHYNKYLQVPGEAIVYFVDGIMFQMPDMMTNNPMGLQDFTKIPFAVPNELPPGHYKMKMTVVYKVNPFREVEYTLESNYFDVVK